MKIKNLLKSNCDIKDAICTVTDEEKIEALKEINDEISTIDEGEYSLNESSREVSNMISGYVARKMEPLVGNCCSGKLVGECEHNGYIKLLTRGGLLIPSQELSDAVAKSFALLDEFSKDIRKCTLKSREAAEHVLRKCLPITDICCKQHAPMVYQKLNRTVTNIFLNNRSKRKSDELLKDKVMAFKRMKLDKRR